MPNQGQTATSPADAEDGLSFYAPDGAVVRPANGHPQAPTPPVPDPFSDQSLALEPRPLEAMTQSIHFWQGLAVGLGVAVVVIFLTAAVLAS